MAAGGKRGKYTRDGQKGSYCQAICEQIAWPEKIELAEGEFLVNGEPFFRHDDLMAGGPWEQLAAHMEREYPRHGVATFLPKLRRS